MKYYFRGMDEPSLAAYQQAQVGNGCAICAVSAAINLLSGKDAKADEWRKRVDAIPFPEILRYRTFAGGPTTPAQQVHLAEWVSYTVQLPIRSVAQASLDRQGLLDYLATSRAAVLVTIGWWAGHAPEIVNGQDQRNLNQGAARVGYHTMLLAAYDDAHVCRDGVLRPWGLINSWQNGGPYLYWMRADDFLRSWGVYTPWGGKNAAVLIQLL